MVLIAASGRRRNQAPESIFDGPLNVAVDGNSIFADFYTSIGTFDNHLMAVEPLASSNASHGGVAVSGASWSDLIAKAASTVDLLWNEDAANNILVVIETINSLYDGVTVDTIKTQIESYLAGRLALHPWRVIYVRTMPYGGSSEWATFNANMTEIDDWVEANAATLGVEVVIDPRVLPVFDHDGTTAGPFAAYASSWHETAVPYIHPLDAPKLELAALIVEAMAAMPAERARAVKPYNAPTPLTTPTYDGSGQSVHPDVVDMVQQTGSAWNGYRYWMAMTPYAASNDDLENPSILASNDGLTWVVPAGLTNPIDPFPGGAAYNSDTDLAWDADNNRMVCYWRHYTGSSGVEGNLTFCYSTSTDGITWTAQADVFALTFPNGAIFSPAVVRVAEGDWRMWLVDSDGPSQVRTATTATGTWSAPTNCTFNGTQAAGVTGGFWHWDVIRHGGIFYGLVSSNIGDLTNAALYAMTSADGIAWSVNTTPVMNGRNDWDRNLYRATLVRDGSTMRVWYSARSAANVWRIGHTRIPIDEWPSTP